MTLTRKSFLKVLGVAFAGMAILPAPHAFGSILGKTKPFAIRIRPISGRNYSPSFLRFCERAKFSSAREAIKKVKNRRVEYLLVVERA
jgi:hypothetical protein